MQDRLRILFEAVDPKAMVNALKQVDEPPVQALVDWFGSNLPKADSDALTVKNDKGKSEWFNPENLVSEDRIKELAGMVKDSLNKQQARIQKEFNDITAQLDMKDPERARKIIPSEVRSMVNSRDMDRFRDSAETTSKKGTDWGKNVDDDTKLANLARALLLVLGSPGDGASQKERNRYESVVGCAGLNNAQKDKLNDYTGMILWSERDFFQLTVIFEDVASGSYDPKALDEDIQRTVKMLSSKSTVNASLKDTAVDYKQVFFCSKIASALSRFQLTNNKIFDDLFDEILEELNRTRNQKKENT